MFWDAVKSPMKPQAPSQKKAASERGFQQLKGASSSLSPFVENTMEGGLASEDVDFFRKNVQTSDQHANQAERGMEPLRTQIDTKYEEEDPDVEEGSRSIGEATCGWRCACLTCAAHADSRARLSLR